MNVLKRAFLYDTQKRGKSLTLFLLFTLITIFVTISFSVLSATQAAATNLRETVGASFTLRGKPMEFSADETDFAMQFAPISQQDIDLIAGSTEIKACNAQQSATATASGFIFPSGMPSGTISANTSSVWNRNFTSGIVTLAEGQHILADEPTGNLDEDTAAEIMAILKESAHNSGKCVVIVTHSNELAKEADVVFRLRKGDLQISDASDIEQERKKK